METRQIQLAELGKDEEFTIPGEFGNRVFTVTQWSQSGSMKIEEIEFQNPSMMVTVEEKYIELAIRVKKSDWDKIPKEVTAKIWEWGNSVININIDCEVIAIGVDGFISDKID